MKYLFLAMFTLVFNSHNKNILVQNSFANWRNANLNDKIKSNKMKLKIGSDIFIATLYDNETTVALKAMLPLTLNMTELNGNEKYNQLSADLPTSTAGIGTIREGDLMLWGANTFVLFYKTFKTTYRYTRLGHIDNPRGLASAVGSGSVTIFLSAEQKTE